MTISRSISFNKSLNGKVIKTTSSFLQYFDIFYQSLLKPTIIYIYKIYYSRYAKLKPHRVNNDIFFYSSRILAKKIRDKQVCLFS